MGKPMTFFCLCMSPALDATVYLPRAPKGDGEIFKCVREDVFPGGKAVNVARWLARRGEKVAVGGLLGEDNAAPFERELSACGIADRFVRVAGETRRNEMITWPGGSVKINRPAFPRLVGGAWDAVLSKVDWLPAGVAIVSGSLPPAVPCDFYAKAASHFRSSGWKVVVDASGEAMKLALEAGTDLVKPNAEECEALVGFVPKAPEEFLRATRLLREKAAHVVISDGGSGAWFDGTFVAAPEVDVVDTTAAGDTLLAEFCWRVWGGGQAECGGMAEAAEWAVAAGSASCTMPGGSPPDIEFVNRLKGRK